MGRKIKAEKGKIQKKTSPSSGVEYTVTELSGWHRILFWFKALLVMSYLFNVIAFVQDGISSAGWLDLLINIAYIVLLSASIVNHSRKAGVYLFFAYGILELLYNLVIMAMAAGNGVFEGAVGNRAFEYLFFSLVILVPTALYYRKRMDEFLS